MNIKRAIQPFPVAKMEAVGNDFILIEADHTPVCDYAALAKRLCSRPFGLGSDGLLVLEPSERAVLRMRMFNPDGTEDFCGNGLRCAARYAYDKDFTDQTTFAIEAMNEAIVPVQVLLNDLGAVEATRIALASPEFQTERLPSTAQTPEIRDYPIEMDGQTFPIHTVNTGTTHTVIFVDALPGDDLFFRISPLLEHHPLFPERTSVLWVVLESPSVAHVRIWERGVGETYGCGTGAAAIAAIAQREAKTQNPLQVVSKGGTLTVRWLPGEPVHLEGPVNWQMQGTFLG